MKLKIKEFNKLARENDYACGYDLWICLDGGEDAYSLLQKGTCELGYEMARKIYNTFGEVGAIKVIDFGEETIGSFKSKYIEVGNALIGVTDMDDNAFALRSPLLKDELIYLFEHGKPIRKVFPDWYFTGEFFSFDRRALKEWKESKGMTWAEIAQEIGLSPADLAWKRAARWRWTMMDLICFLDLMGAKDLFNIVFFPSVKLRTEIKKRIDENEQGGNK